MMKKGDQICVLQSSLIALSYRLSFLPQLSIATPLVVSESSSFCLRALPARLPPQLSPPRVASSLLSPAFAALNDSPFAKTAKAGASVIGTFTGSWQAGPYDFAFVEISSPASAAPLTQRFGLSDFGLEELGILGFTKSACGFPGERNMRSERCY